MNHSRVTEAWCEAGWDGCSLAGVEQWPLSHLAACCDVPGGGWEAGSVLPATAEMCGPGAVSATL